MPAVADGDEVGLVEAVDDGDDEGVDDDIGAPVEETEEAVSPVVDVTPAV